VRDRKKSSVTPRETRIGSAFGIRQHAHTSASASAMPMPRRPRAIQRGDGGRAGLCLLQCTSTVGPIPTQLLDRPHFVEQHDVKVVVDPGWSTPSGSELFSRKPTR